MKDLVSKDAAILTYVFVCVRLQEIMYASVPGDQKGYQIWDWSYSCLWAIMWELGTELSTSGKSSQCSFLLSHLSNCKGISLTRFLLN